MLNHIDHCQKLPQQYLENYRTTVTKDGKRPWQTKFYSKGKRWDKIGLMGRNSECPHVLCIDSTSDAEI